MTPSLAMRERSGRAGGLLLLLLAACTVGTEGNGFGPGSGPAVATSDAMTSTGGTATGSGSGGSEAGTQGADDTGSGDGPTQTTSSCEGMAGTAPVGQPCTDGCECASGECFSIVLGAACSECVSDAQCMAGGGAGTCSIDLMADPPYAGCTSGELGVMCQLGSGGCQAGLLCVQVIDTMGFIPDYFCSECATSADCAAGQTCSPVVEIVGVLGGGYLQCVGSGSVPDGGLCPLLPSGLGDGTVCASGRCAVADVAGVAQIGVCSSCVGDGDCAAGQICQPATVDETGGTPAICV